MTLSVSDVLMMIAKTKFKPFNQNDYAAFGGVESANPLIGETADDNLIVIDGGKVSVFVIGDDGSWPDQEEMFVLKNLF